MKIMSEKAHEMLCRQGANKGKVLRITVKAGGCAGMSYDAEIDSGMRADDLVFCEEGGITVVSNEKSINFLTGLYIDYSDDLISAGFRFSNSSNESSCGCGASFTLAGFPTLNNEGVTCGS